MHEIEIVINGVDALNTLQTILFPLITLFEALLGWFYSIFGSYGVSIGFLSISTGLALAPLSRWARELEQRNKTVLEKMAPRIEKIQIAYKGRDCFERIDAIYSEYSYHPIKSMASLLPILMYLPFILAAFLLLRDYPALKDVSFLMINDLSKQDALTGINVLPVLVVGIALLDSRLRSESTVQSRRKFLIVSAVLMILIYRMPSAVCLYWLSTNVWTLGQTLWFERRRNQDEKQI
ncbi:MAG: YidC/Oxa1 family membrane protein insertase [Gammaproteobacteria bacterium]